MKENLRTERGITLIALVITIIVLLILAGVSIAMLTGQNGILTQANNAKVENSHGAVKDAIALLYNEYQIQINTGSTTKLASTETVQIQGAGEKALANTSMTFLDFLKGGNAEGITYIKEGTDNVLDVEKLTGGKQALGNGTDEDVYKIEEENGSYVVKYYESETKSETLWSTSISASSEDAEPDWNTILAQATSPHPDQKESNDIGIGTDGKLVNLDLWYYEKTEDGKGYKLSTPMGSYLYTGYMGEVINGKIEGTVPQYIKVEGEGFLPVTEMSNTFQKHTNDLKEAPDIPTTVENMEFAFYNCKALEKAPEIPSRVTNMHSTFYGCSALTGTMLINANPTSYEECFTRAATAEGTDLKLTGSSTMLEELLDTKSDNSNISILN